jgi:transcriptional regulator with XRE-family HTH domain
VKDIRTDAAEDAVSSLELAASFLESALTDDRYWKWFVVATHSAVQGIFVLALKAGDGLLVQKLGVTQKRIAAYEADTRPPLPHMDNFFNLYKKLHKKENLRSSDSVPIQPSEVHEQAVKSLDELRDEFLHFNAKSWSIERELIFVSVRGCLELMEFIISKSSTIIWYEQNQKERVHVALERLQLLLYVRNSASSP